MQKQAVIVISSHVVRGTVGSRASAFALEVCGYPVWNVPTVTLPWHPGHGPASRIVPPAESFATMLRELGSSPWISEVGAVLSGYLGDESQVDAVAGLVGEIKARNAGATYLLDPVMGDGGHLYIPAPTAESMRERLLPIADIVTPNRFELGWLTGSSGLDRNESMLEAAASLGVQTVLVTSAEAMMRNNTANLLLHDNKAWLAEHRVMDGPFGDKLGEAMAAKGLVPLAWYDSGARSFYNSQKPITTPADLGGMKFRVMNNELFVGMVEALGGNATPMAFSEVYQSLKTGVVDGAENNWPSYESTNHYEVAGYYSLSQHLILPECLCVSKASWDQLSADEQAKVRQAARDSAELQRKLWAERAKASQEKVLASGVKFNEIADKAPFQDAMGAVYAAAIAKTPALEQLIADIKAVD